MISRLEFNKIIKDILGSLYDIAALEIHPAVFSVIKLPLGFSGSKGESVRQFMLEAIEQLRPVRDEVSLTSSEWRSYLIIKKRYIEGIGIQELSDALAISPRQLRRDHHKALQTLTEILWVKYSVEENAEEGLDQVQIFEVHNEMVDPLETTRGVFALLKRQLDEKGIRVDFVPSNEFIPVVTDRVILRQILISIFNNILHHQLGKRLVISCAAIESQVQIKFSICFPFGWESLEGVEREDELATVRYWCDRIHARIEERIVIEGAQSRVDRVLWLPHSDQKIMLVIDDQEAVANLFKRYLSQTEILVIGISHPEEALALARKLRPALITLDVMMPQVDGWELLQFFKLDEILKHIPVIVCSAWNDPDLSQSLGAAAYLKKPVTQKMLLQEVQKFLGLQGE